MKQAKSRKGHVFQIELNNADLSPKQVQQIAAAIRGVTAQQLLSLDFRIDDLAKVIRGTGTGLPEGLNCGGCSMCSM